MKSRINLLLVTLLLNSGFVLANNEISTLVVGGNDTSAGDWPWMVYVHAGNYACGGTLIDATTVLTAAHCVHDGSSDEIPATEISIITGEYDLANIADSATIAISQTYIHSDYDPTSTTSSNDIALLKLVSAVTSVLPLDRADATTTNAAVSNESDVTLVGWGSTVGYDYQDASYVVPNYPDILQEAEMPLHTDTYCTNSYAMSADGSSYYNAATMVCAGETGTGACQGDSGGPIIYNNGGNWEQIGIASFSSGCASDGYPAGYTRVATYNDWIDNILRNVSIDNQLIFGDIEEGDTLTLDLIISNNAEIAVVLSFDLSDDSQFSFDANACSTIAANQSCSLPITYAPTDAALGEAILSIMSDLDDATAVQTTFYGGVLVASRTAESSGGGSLLFILSLPLLWLRRRL